MSLITKEAIEGKKVNIKEFYNLPEKVIHCSKCVVSNQRPRIIFDEAATGMYRQMSVTDSVYHGCSPFSKFIVFVRACAVHSSII